MRNPPNYGSINKLKGTRRRPYWVRTPLRKELVDGKIVRKRETIGYYATKQEALNALAEYNNRPLVAGVYTVSDIWAKTMRASSWSEERAKKLNRMFELYFANIANMNIKDVRTENLQKVLDDSNKHSATKQALKAIINAIYRFSLANDYIYKDYSPYVTYDMNDTAYVRTVFTDEEVQKLWKRSGEWIYDLMLILLYTGCRVSEIIKNKADNLDLDNKTIYVPEEISKNKQSVRIIPIHDKILPLVKAHMGQEWLFEHNGYKVSYQNIPGRYMPKINEYLGSNHTTHETRHTFTSELKKKKVDLYYIDELVGHKHNNITEDIYTHANIEDLRNEINKINYGL